MKGSPSKRCPICGDRFNQRKTGAPVCSQMCAVEALARVEIGCVVMGLDWRDFLPQDQRPDKVPWPAWEAAMKLNGKAHWRKIKTE